MVSIKSRPTDYLEGRFWREGYDDVLVPGRDAAMTKLRYMHDNPVRRGLATCAEDYRWSSAPWYYEKGESVVALEQLPFPAGNRCA